MPLHKMYAYLLFLLLFANIPPSLSNLENGFLYKTCSNLFNCGMLTGVDFPFWGQDRSRDCGHPQLELKCINNAPMIDIMDIRYHVLDITNATKVLKIARDDYFGGICTSKFVNTTIDPMLFDYAPGSTNLTILYGCPLFSEIGFNISNCDMDGVPFSYEGVHVMPGVHGPENCKTSVIVPVIGIDWLQSANYTGLGQVLMNDGFKVVWKMNDNACSECISSGGRCGYDPHLNKSTCFCPYQILGAETCFTSPLEAQSPPAVEAPPVVEAPPPRPGFHHRRFYGASGT